MVWGPLGFFFLFQGIINKTSKLPVAYLLNNTMMLINPYRPGFIPIIFSPHNFTRFGVLFPWSKDQVPFFLLLQLAFPFFTENTYCQGINKYGIIILLIILSLIIIPAHITDKTSGSL